MLAACLEAPPQQNDVDAVDAGGDGQPDCDALFGGLEDYTPCDAPVGACSFYAEVGEDFLCQDLCAEFGTECESSFNTSGASGNCEPTSEDEKCIAPHDGQICICLLPDPVSGRGAEALAGVDDSD